MSNESSITLASMVVGDTFDELTCAMSSTGTALASHLASVTITWIDTEGNAGPIWTSASGPITITDAANWQWKVNKIAADTRAIGLWLGDVLCVDSDSDRKTRSSILQKVTKHP